MQYSDDRNDNTVKDWSEDDMVMRAGGIQEQLQAVKPTHRRDPRRSILKRASRSDQTGVLFLLTINYTKKIM
jgi:glycyl-tRNA synthetase (class II)